MKTLIHFLSGATVTAGLSTAMIGLLGQKLMIGPMTLITVMLAGLTIGVWYLDKRVRGMLLDLCKQLMEFALEKDKALVYHDAYTLHEEILEGKPLTLASKEIGRLSSIVEMETSDAGFVV